MDEREEAPGARRAAAVPCSARWSSSASSRTRQLHVAKLDPYRELELWAIYGDDKGADRLPAVPGAAHRLRAR